MERGGREGDEKHVQGKGATLREDILDEGAIIGAQN